ncbi:UNVERIFIED_ORG: hypothetical protein M2438_004901 [Methylobacterium sp. SuP10 SLI 274]|nr:hypothetical protein [Methylobacterium sp. SuP10 SLI 274]
MGQVAGVADALVAQVVGVGAERLIFLAGARQERAEQQAGSEADHADEERVLGDEVLRGGAALVQAAIAAIREVGGALALRLVAVLGPGAGILVGLACPLAGGANRVAGLGASGIGSLAHAVLQLGSPVRGLVAQVACAFPGLFGRVLQAGLQAGIGVAALRGRAVGNVVQIVLDAGLAGHAGAGGDVLGQGLHRHASRRRGDRALMIGTLAHDGLRFLVGRRSGMSARGVR